VLVRAAVAALPPGTRLPRQVFLLGSPIQPSHLAQKLQHNWGFRALAGDCGQLLASPTRMDAIGPAKAPTICIQGSTGWRGRISPFKHELNDGLVAVSEASAAWATEMTQVPVLHTYMPSNRLVSQLILARIANQVQTAPS